MISVRRWDSVTRKMLQLHPEVLKSPNRANIEENDILWIDLENPSPDEEKLVLQEFMPVHPLTLEDINKPRREPEQGVHFPKIEEFQGYLFIVVNPLTEEMLRFGGRKQRLPATASEPLPTITVPNVPLQEEPRSKRRTHTQLSAVLSRQVMITHHYESLHSVGVLREWLNRHPESMERGPDYLFHLILDDMVDEYAPLIDQISSRLDRLEVKIFNNPSAELLAQMLRLKRIISSVRKTLILEREVLARLFRGEFAFVDEVERIYYRNVFDHLVRYSELVETGREMVSDLMQTHLAAMSNRMNSIMKALAMVSTVILPMSLIASIYGMNFKQNFPEIEWEYGYPMALTMMITLASTFMYFFYKKKWF